MARSAEPQRRRDHQERIPVRAFLPTSTPRAAGPVRRLRPLDHDRRSRRRRARSRRAPRARGDLGRRHVVRRVEEHEVERGLGGRSRSRNPATGARSTCARSANPVAARLRGSRRGRGGPCRRTPRSPRRATAPRCRRPAPRVEVEHDRVLEPAGRATRTAPPSRGRSSGGPGPSAPPACARRRSLTRHDTQRHQLIDAGRRPRRRSTITVQLIGAGSYS